MENFEQRASIPPTPPVAGGGSSAQPQFYSLDAPTVIAPEPWFKNKRVLIMLGAGAFAIIFTILLIVFAMNFIQNSSAPTRTRLSEAEGIMNEKAAECDDGDADCMGEARSDAARSVGEVKACNGLEGAEYTKCVTLISRDKKDPELCKTLAGEDRTMCEDGSYLLQARQEGNSSLCAEITDPTTKNACEASFVSLSADVMSVVASGDPSGCDVLTGGDQDACLDLFSSTDEDKDGLTLGEEFVLKTSDKNADTDGDGYTDKEEVAAGYDPLKK